MRSFSIGSHVKVYTSNAHILTHPTLLDNSNEDNSIGCSFVLPVGLIRSLTLTGPSSKNIIPSVNVNISGKLELIESFESCSKLLDFKLGIIKFNTHLKKMAQNPANYDK